MPAAATPKAPYSQFVIQRRITYSLCMSSSLRLRRGIVSLPWIFLLLIHVFGVGILGAFFYNGMREVHASYIRPFPLTTYSDLSFGASFLYPRGFTIEKSKALFSGTPSLSISDQTHAKGYVSPGYGVLGSSYMRIERITCDEEIDYVCPAGVQDFFSEERQDHQFSRENSMTMDTRKFIGEAVITERTVGPVPVQIIRSQTEDHLLDISELAEYEVAYYISPSEQYTLTMSISKGSVMNERVDEIINSFRKLK